MRGCINCSECKHCQLAIKDIDIDELMQKSVCILNKKGYKTLFCCAGHENEDFVGTYIIIENQDKFEHIPKGFYQSKQGNNLVIRASNVAFRLWKTADIKRRTELLMEVNYILLSWIDNLPKNNYN